MWVCEAQAWVCGNAGKSWSFFLDWRMSKKADDHRRYGQCYESEPFHRVPRACS
jgi:hypothetical protein